MSTNRIQDSYWKGGQHGMGKPYSKDLRERVVGAAQDGATIPETAEQLGVSVSSVVRFRRLHRETGSVSPAKFGGYKGYALAAHEELVRQLVAEQPDPSHVNQFFAMRRIVRMFPWRRGRRGTRCSASLRSCASWP